MMKKEQYSCIYECSLQLNEHEHDMTNDMAKYKSILFIELTYPLADRDEFAPNQCSD